MSDGSGNDNIEPEGWPANFPADADDGDWERFRDGDKAAGFEVLDNFQRFRQRDDIFCRARWDDVIDADKVKAFMHGSREPAIRKADGFRQRDFALRNASWVVANVFRERGAEDGVAEGFQDPLHEFRPVYKVRQEVASAAAMTAEIKRVARLFGADLVGITEFDRRWVYASKYSIGKQEERPNEPLDGITSVIVLGHGMNYELIKSYPSATATAAVGQGYSSEAATAMQVSQYIRSLGYQAVATMNDTALAIPYAIKAGLGEYGRHNMVITKEFGPRVRFSKIFTDLPLDHDAPARFGVAEFCNICDRCVTACPPRAVPAGEPEAEPLNRSNVTGVRKWQVDAEKCYRYWTNLGSDCGVCIRVCPFNKDFSRWYMRAARRLAGTGLRRLVARLDKRLGYGRRVAPQAWWDGASGG